MPTREYRATVTFAVAAAVGLVVVLLGAGLASQLLALAPTAVVLAIGTIAIYAIEAYGLNIRAGWARSAMTPLLWIVLIEGVIQFLVSLLQSSINIPLGSLLALWSLSAGPDERLGPVPVASGAGLVLIIAAIAGAVLPLPSM